MRYAGVGAVFVGAALIAFFPASRPRRARLAGAAAYTGGAVLVPVLYLVRNASVSGSYLGQDRSTGARGGLSGLRSIPDVFAEWGFGKPVSGLLVVFGVMLVAVLVGGAVMRLVRSSRARQDASEPRDGRSGAVDALTVLGAYWLGLFVFMIALRLAVFYDLDGRTLNLLFPLGLVFGAGLLGRVSAEGVANAAAVLFVGWTLLVSVLGVRALADVRSRGSGYHDRAYDATYDELRSTDVHSYLPDGCELRTNEPNVLYLAGVEAASTPRVGVPEPSEGGGPVPCVVWFDPSVTPTDDLLPIDEVTRSLHLVPTHRGVTFVVYLPAGVDAHPT